MHLKRAPLLFEHMVEFPVIEIPEVENLRQIWMGTIIIGFCLMVVGVIFRHKKINKKKVSNVLLIVGIIIIVCQGGQLLNSYI